MALAKRPNATVATFSLPEWDFGKRGREELLGTTAFGTASLCLARASMHQMEHDAELCRSNTTGQETTRRRLEEDIAWSNTLGSFWNTNALSNMNDNLVDAVCDRCRTGLALWTMSTATCSFCEYANRPGL